jgi:hypothetical protein
MFIGGKTLEGSLACFAVAWCCTWGVLVLVVPAPAGELAATAALVALVAAAMEALGPRGLDNLLLPLGTFAALDASGVAELAAPGNHGVGAAISIVAAAALVALAALPVARQPACATAPGGDAR